MLAGVARQGQRRDDGVQRGGGGRAVDVAVGGQGEARRAAEHLGGAQRAGELVDHQPHVGRQARRLGLAKLAPRRRIVAHGRQHTRQFQPHPHGLGLLVQQRPEQHGRLAETLGVGQHHAVAEAGLGANLGVGIVGQSLIDRLGVGRPARRPRLVGEIEELRGREVRGGLGGGGRCEQGEERR